MELQARSRRLIQPTLYVVFTVSGAAGLIYENIWSRYLALFLGHSAYAQVLVIAIFLGGMAVGALLAGSRSQRWRDPLKWYMGAELAIGVLGLLFHGVFLALTGFAYDSIFPALTGSWLLEPVKWALAAALILPQSILLGTTFPLMAAGVMRRFGRLPGRTLAILYFANSLGAAVGVLVAGFYLLAVAGLPGTLLAAALLNLAVALVTAVIAHLHPAEAELQVEAAPAIEGAAAGAGLGLNRLAQLLLAVSFGTAVASFAYEIGWLRMLALVLGSATHSFELMLSAFILGLALGSFWVRGRADRWADPLRALGIVQLAMGLTAMATLVLYGASFHWMAELMRTFARTDSGYTGFNLARYGICLAIMFPASFCAGMTLPLITRTLLVGGVGERAIGAVYGVNTLGSIVGVAIAGLLLMPWIGLKGLIVGGATLDMAIGVAILFVGAGRRSAALRLAYAAGAMTIAAAVVGVVTKGFATQLLLSGVYRFGLLVQPGEYETLYYADGRTATVGVVRAAKSGMVTISTNGKPDASLAAYWFDACSDTTVRQPLMGDASTQALAPLITLAHARDPKIAAVIGQGSGMSSHFLLGDDRLEKVVTIEIEPDMIRCSKLFYPANRRVFDDPRSEIVIEDAKTYFASAPLKFDVIFSEPSNPWVSGISSLFSTEFYTHLKRYLSKDGVFGQWIHLYSIDDALVLSILAALHDNFRSYEVFMTASTDMLVVASDAPLPPPDWTVFQRPGIASALCHNLPPTREALEATRVTHRAALAPLLDDWGAPNSDFYPILDLLAERSRYRHDAANGFVGLPIELFDVTAPFFGRRMPPGVGGPAPFPEIPRVGRLAIGAALRGTAADSALAPKLAESVRAARYRRDAWNAMLRDGQPPADWLEWLDNFKAIERDVEAGTAAYVDEAIYRPVLRYMDGQGAPKVVRDIVTFRHGLAGWDFGEAAGAARSLLAEKAQEGGYISADELLDGGVVAMLRTGDVAGAIEFHDRLAGQRRRSPGDLRSRLVEAYVDAFRNGKAGS